MIHQPAWQYPAVDAGKVSSLSRSLSIHPVTAEILVRRGLGQSGVAQAFLKPRESDTHSPRLMKGMAAVRERVIKAVGNKERITIYGDYDADGIPGTSLLYNYLRAAGAKVDYLIPQREDGYGLSKRYVDKMVARGSQVVITIDCGSSDHEAITYARSQGLEMIVTDHHLTLKGPPPTPYFINPHRSDGESYPFNDLCGCGVAYKLVQAISSRDHEPALYDLLAISTVCDMVTLVDENRYYVRAALDRLHERAKGNIGLRAIADTAGVALHTLNEQQIAFRIGPRINAMGRMQGDPNSVVELLTTDDHGRATTLAKELARHNRARQEFTDELASEAFRSLDRGRTADFIVAYLPDATVGVTGLIASKITERYNRPTLVVNSEGRGSGRAPRGIDMMPYMAQLKSRGVFGSPRRNSAGETVIPDFGGHAGACGLHNVDVDKLKSEASRLSVPRSQLEATMQIEGSVRLEEVNRNLAGEMEKLSPFGVGNPEPLIAITGLEVTSATATKDGRHLQLQLREGKVERRAFMPGAGDLVNKLSKRVDVAGVPGMSDFTGDPELRLSGLRSAQ